MVTPIYYCMGINTIFNQFANALSTLQSYKAVYQLEAKALEIHYLLVSKRIITCFSSGWRVNDANK